VTQPNVPQLLSTADLASFQQSDPNWFLNAAGETIRNFCQWHIFPNIPVTQTVPIQPDGTIMLPSLYVTDVAEVSIAGVQIDPTSYQWHQAGWIHQTQPQPYWPWPLYPLQSDQPFREYGSPLSQFADVTYTHGHLTMPAVVAAVGMELATRAMELPSGVASRIASGPYSIDLVALGIVLTDEQRRRLGPFTLVRF
jgi:hypothetical protein